MANKSENWSELEKSINLRCESLRNNNEEMLAIHLERAFRTSKSVFDNLQDLLAYLYDIEDYIQNKALFIPSQSRTIASYKGNKEYMYDGEGGNSWLVPYYTGILALALQVNPELRNQELIELVDSAAVVNTNGVRIISPERVIELALASRNN